MDYFIFLIKILSLTTVILCEEMSANEQKNVLGTELKPCCYDPMTGWYRDGYCKTDGRDQGVHTVCAQMTEQFLNYTKIRGNDLSTPHLPHFPGLMPGDKWCLCVSRWKEAFDTGYGPKVVLESTHSKSLQVATLAELKSVAVPFKKDEL